MLIITDPQREIWYQQQQQALALAQQQQQHANMVENSKMRGGGNGGACQSASARHPISSAVGPVVFSDPQREIWYANNRENNG